MVREETAGPESGPQSPFPIKISGRIVKGFGRGSRELGIPTANLPVSGLDVGGHTDITNGIYYGWAGISFANVVKDSSAAAEPPKPGSAEHKQIHQAREGDGNAHVAADIKVYPAVVSIGFNPYYKNEKRSVEVHVMHKFDSDFYNASMNLSILAYIRPEQGYDSVEALIEDIKTDIRVSERSLQRPAYIDCRSDPFLTNFGWDS